MSGVPRLPPTEPATPFWNPGREKTLDRPPPLDPQVKTGPGTPIVELRSFQTLSGAVRSPAALRCSWVPPTDVTSGSDSGQEIVLVEEQQIKSCGFAQPELGLQISSVEPWSPLPARTVTLCWAALKYAE